MLNWIFWKLAITITIKLHENSINVPIKKWSVPISYYLLCQLHVNYVTNVFFLLILLKVWLYFTWLLNKHQINSIWLVKLLMPSYILCSYLSHCVKDCFIFSSLTLSVCRCDPHSWPNCTRRSRRAGEESPEIMLQEQPENSHWKRCTFCGKNGGMRWRDNGRWGWFLLWDKKRRERKLKIEDIVSCFMLKEKMKERRKPETLG